MPSNPPIPTPQHRNSDTKLSILIIGAGLGGLSAALSLLLSGHTVTILESTPTISEIGAGIQCLPNATRILLSWGLGPALAPHATRPRMCNMRSWKGEVLSRMDFWEYERALGVDGDGDGEGAPFWDFHRAELQAALLGRVRGLGGEVVTGGRVVDVVTNYSSTEGGEVSSATAICADGRRFTADLVVGADGINSRCREVLLGRSDPPVLTGDLAYRLLLNTEDMMRDEELRGLVEDPQVNYWIGPGMHAVNYILRTGKLFNMVLLVPDDLPPSTNTLAGDVSEMRSLFTHWDPVIRKLLALCTSVSKWRLMIRPSLNPSWSHPSAAFTMLGDAAHATLPYLASGAGMSIEDGHVLGLCLGRIKGKSVAEKKMALEVYERCRRARTEKVVERGNVQQYLYHVDDGPEQRERDERLRAFGEFNGRGKVGEKEFEEKGLRIGEDPLAWRWGGVGSWLLTYRCEEDVERRWREVEGEMRLRRGRGEEESIRAVL